MTHMGLSQNREIPQHVWFPFWFPECFLMVSYPQNGFVERKPGRLRLRQPAALRPSPGRVGRHRPRPLRRAGGVIDSAVPGWLWRAQPRGFLAAVLKGTKRNPMCFFFCWGGSLKNEHFPELCVCVLWCSCLFTIYAIGRSQNQHMFHGAKHEVATDANYEY